MSGWLSPYRIIDLSDERGLLAGQMLAKLGADVITTIRGLGYSLDDPADAPRA